MTEVGRLFQMASTAELKARPPYAVLVRGAWCRGRVDERNLIVTDEPECSLETRHPLLLLNNTGVGVWLGLRVGGLL